MLHRLLHLRPRLRPCHARTRSHPHLQQHGPDTRIVVRTSRAAVVSRTVGAGAIRRAAVRDRHRHRADRQPATRRSGNGAAGARHSTGLRRARRSGGRASSTSSARRSWSATCRRWPLRRPRARACRRSPWRTSRGTGSTPHYPSVRTALAPDVLDVIRRRLRARHSCAAAALRRRVRHDARRRCATCRSSRDVHGGGATRPPAARSSTTAGRSCSPRSAVTARAAVRARLRATNDVTLDRHRLRDRSQSRVTAFDGRLRCFTARRLRARSTSATRISSRPPTSSSASPATASCRSASPTARRCSTRRAAIRRERRLVAGMQRVVRCRFISAGRSAKGAGSRRSALLGSRPARHDDMERHGRRAAILDAAAHIASRSLSRHTRSFATETSTADRATIQEVL